MKRYNTDEIESFWAMCGENITYTDMDHVKMEDLR